SGTSQDDTDISIAESTDGGTSFGKAQNLSNNPELSFNPQISLNRTYLNVVWKEKADDGKLSTNKKVLYLPQFGQENQSSSNEPRIVSGLFANVTNATDSNGRQSVDFFNVSSFLYNSTANKYFNGTNLYLHGGNYTSTISVGNYSSYVAEKERLLLAAEISLKDHLLSAGQANQTTKSNSTRESALLALPAPQAPSALLMGNKTCTCGVKAYEKIPDRTQSPLNNKNVTVFQGSKIEANETRTKQTYKYLNNSNSNSFPVLFSSPIEQKEHSQIEELDSHANKMDPNYPYTIQVKKDKTKKSTDNTNPEIILTKKHNRLEKLTTKKVPLSPNPDEPKPASNDVTVRQGGQPLTADKKNNPVTVNRNNQDNEINNKKEIKIRVEGNEQKQSQDQKVKDKTKVQTLFSKADRALGKAKEIMNEAKIINQNLEETKQDLKHVQNPQNGINGQPDIKKVHRLESLAKTMNQKASDALQKYEKLRLDAIKAIDDFNKRYR
ncbi:MAG TPA: hypothetical protein VF884_10185, partial [Nitrososphaeraceae archaeon]